MSGERPFRMKVSANNVMIDRALMEDLKREAQSSEVTVATMSKQPAKKVRLTFDRSKVRKAVGLSTLEYTER